MALNYIEEEELIEAIQLQGRLCHSSCRLLKDVDFRVNTTPRTGSVSQDVNSDLCYMCNGIIWNYLFSMFEDMRAKNRIYKLKRENHQIEAHLAHMDNEISSLKQLLEKMISASKVTHSC